MRRARRSVSVPAELPETGPARRPARRYVGELGGSGFLPFTPYIVPLINRSGVGVDETSRVFSKNLHWSYLISGSRCLRAWQLVKAFGIDPVPKVVNRSSSEHLLWCIGRAVEGYVTGVLVSGKPASVFGDSRCSLCGKLATGLHSEFAVCCSKPTEYLGLHLGLTESEGVLGLERLQAFSESIIVGSVDLALMVGGRLLVVEIKSIQGKDFDGLPTGLRVSTGVSVDYCLQASGYVHLAMRALGEDRVWPYSVLLYVNKGFKFGMDSTYREIHVPYSEFSDRIEGLVFSAREAFGTTLFRKMSICERKGRGCGMAKECPVADICFRTDCNEIFGDTVGGLGK